MKKCVEVLDVKLDKDFVGFKQPTVSD